MLKSAVLQAILISGAMVDWGCLVYELQVSVGVLGPERPALIAWVQGPESEDTGCNICLKPAVCCTPFCYVVGPKSRQVQYRSTARRHVGLAFIRSLSDVNVVRSGVCIPP
jgi:hypothetical protein